LMFVNAATKNKQMAMARKENIFFMKLF